MPHLDQIYEQLDFESGSLFAATDNPLKTENDSDWLEKGEWISAANRIGADKILFVENNPVVVFSKCESTLEGKIKAFNKAWCLARPRILFLATPTEISVYDLAQKPIDIYDKKSWNELKSLVTLQTLSKVSNKLQKFHRDNIESGKVFADKRFGDLKNRADKALIRDLKTVRSELIDAGLDGNRVRFAHALIGRSIFIRYLEDRNILTKEYFDKIAKLNPAWSNILDSSIGRSGVDFSEQQSFYPRILSDKAFTYALFRNLARDFNGDMFPDVEGEEKIVAQRHLNKIQDLLYGDVGIQKKLFFYSYSFDIIPLDLISSIYEEFYHGSVSITEKKRRVRQDGAYYTPPVLAEFVLSNVLSADVLKTCPKIMDPACGSGIFLVEAFRRVVRYNWYKKKRLPTFDELKNILENQILGIEANEEAARITAFSLYLAMLHYLEPPAIDRQIKLGNRLPNLLATQSRSKNNLHCILPKNAFDVDSFEENPVWKKRFGKECVDIVVGNPPWGTPGKKADELAKSRHSTLLGWCRQKNKPIGDRESSQAFLWRALDMLKPNGKAGMLVSAGVLFKHSKTSQAFRKNWFENVRLEEIFNFSHVRKFFFKGGISPFCSLFFSKGTQQDHPLLYWSAKQTINVSKLQAIALSKYDLHTIWPQDLSRLSIWKESWFGRPADIKFINSLKRHKRLAEYSDRDKSGQGFKVASKDKNADKLKSYENLVIDSFSRYNNLSFIDPPAKVHRFGVFDVYNGQRLLVKRGIDEKSSDKGRIIARFENSPFCFTNAIHGIKLKESVKWKYKTILGILWSSIARYFFFMTSSNWGLWHHEIHLDDELLNLPVILDKSHMATSRIINVVDKLHCYKPREKDILNPNGKFEKEIRDKRNELELELDEAVFDLFELNDEQKDLIRDFCDVTLPFFYKPFNCIGSGQAIKQNDLNWIIKYISIFCRRWNAYLEIDEEMRGDINVGSHGNLLAVEFFVSDKSDPYDLKIKCNNWSSILERLGKSLHRPIGVSQIILDGFANIVTDDGIIFIKRNEKRFWTRSIAREDADSTICKRMLDTQPK